MRGADEIVMTPVPYMTCPQAGGHTGMIVSAEINDQKTKNMLKKLPSNLYQIYSKPRTNYELNLITMTKFTCAKYLYDSKQV